MCTCTCHQRHLPVLYSIKGFIRLHHNIISIKLIIIYKNNLSFIIHPPCFFSMPNPKPSQASTTYCLSSHHRPPLQLLVLFRKGPYCNAYMHPAAPMYKTPEKICGYRYALYSLDDGGTGRLARNYRRILMLVCSNRRRRGEGLHVVGRTTESHTRDNALGSSLIPTTSTVTGDIVYNTKS